MVGSPRSNSLIMGRKRFRRISCSVNPRTGAPRPLVGRGEPWGLVQRGALARIDRVRLTGEGQSRRCRREPSVPTSSTL